jgi:tRNA 2-selenouridine synthase
MKQAPVLEVQRPLEQRVDHLVAIYGVQERDALAEATRRIARRLGPQRTSLALDAIERGDWAGACRQMLDYYDRCYDHDLSGHAVSAVDLGRLGPEEAARVLVAAGKVMLG